MPENDTNTLINTHTTFPQIIFGEPMFSFDKWCRVIENRRLGNYPYETTVHALKYYDVLESNIVEYRCVSRA